MKKFALYCLLAVSALALVSNPMVRADESNESDSKYRVINWRPDVETAYNEAVRANKPCVMVFVCPLDREKCVHCKRYRGVWFSEAIQEFADDAVFVIIEIKGDRSSDDPNGAVLYEKFGLTSTPTVAVLEPNAKELRILLQLNGFFAANDLAGHLAKPLRK